MNQKFYYLIQVHFIHVYNSYPLQLEWSNQCGIVYVLAVLHKRWHIHTEMKVNLMALVVVVVVAACDSHSATHSPSSYHACGNQITYRSSGN